MSKDFTVSEQVAIKRLLEPEVKTEAKERMDAGIPCADSSQGRTRDVLSRYAGVSHDTLKKAEAIVQAAESNPA